MGYELGVLFYLVQSGQALAKRGHDALAYGLWQQPKTLV